LIDSASEMAPRLQPNVSARMGRKHAVGGERGRDGVGDHEKRGDDEPAASGGVHPKSRTITPRTGRHSPRDDWEGNDMEFLWFVLIGIAAGWLAGQIMKGGGFGLVGDLIVGVIGALLGGFLFGLLGIHAYGCWGVSSRRRWRHRLDCLAADHQGGPGLGAPNHRVGYDNGRAWSLPEPQEERRMKQLNVGIIGTGWCGGSGPRRVRRILW